MMATVYVRDQGAVVRKRGGRLLITKDGRRLQAIPLVHVDQLVLIGNVQLTTPAAAELLNRGVDIVFFSRYFKFRGRLLHTGSKFAQLRHRQLQVMNDEGACLSIARAVVMGKLMNQHALLRHQAATVQDPMIQQGIPQALTGIRSMLQAAREARTLDSLRGYEGRAGRYYFGAFRLLLRQDLGFQGRAYHPPPDPVNALLSLGYALLLKDITAAVQLVGLDPYLGFFHAIDYGRPSLALDMMEEFRPLVVDPMVLTLVNERRLTERDFRWTNDPRRPVRLSDRGSEVVLRAYEHEIHAEIYHPGVGQKVTYRRCFELQVRQLARVVLGQASGYRPVVLYQE